MQKTREPLDRHRLRRVLSRSARWLIELLDRPAGRPLIGWVLERAIRVIHGQRATLRHMAEGYWVIDWPEQSVPMPQPWPSPSPTHYETLAKDVFLQEYTPSAGDVVVDVGAGVGWELTLFSRLVGPSGRVFAIEADPDTFRWLQRRQKLNDLSNVTLVQAAIADVAGEVLISSEGFHETHRLVHGGPGHRVRALTLDDLVVEQEIPRIRLPQDECRGRRAARPGRHGAQCEVHPQSRNQLS